MLNLVFAMEFMNSLVMAICVFEEFVVLVLMDFMLVRHDEHFGFLVGCV